MPTQIELIHEAAKRGILPEDKRPLYEEALRRGLVPGVEQPVREAKQDLDIGTAQATTGAVGDAARTFDDATSAVGRGLTFGFDDEIYAALTGLGRAGIDAVSGQGFDFGQRYSEQLEKIRQSQKAAQTRSPIASTVGEISGGLVAGGGLGSLLKGARPATSIAVGALEGAGLGAIHGFGTGEGQEDRLRRAGAGAAFGGFTGGALGAIGGRQIRRNVRKAIPTTDDLQAAKTALYDQSERIGLMVNRDSFQRFSDDFAKAMADAGLDKNLHTAAMVPFNRIRDALNDPSSQGITLKGIDIIRQTMKDARGSTDPGVRRIGKIMVNKLDEYLNSLNKSDLIGGQGREAINMLVKARSMNTRFRKAEIIDQMLESARDRAGQFSQSGMENAIRVEFRQLARNPKKMRTFTKAEQDAIKRVSRGDAPQLMARWIGKFAPRGLLSTLMGGGAGFALGGPAGSAGLLTAGELGRQTATSLAKRNVERLQNLVRSGGNLPPRQLTGPQRAVIDALLVQQGQQTPKALPNDEAFPFGISP